MADMDLLKKLSEAMKQNEEKKDSIHSMMGWLAREWEDAMKHLLETKSSLTKCISDLEAREEKIKIAQDSVRGGLEGIDLRRRQVDKGVENLNDKERHIKGLLEKMGKERTMLEQIENLLDQKMKIDVLKEQHIERLLAQLRLTQTSLEEREREVTSKEACLEARTKELASLKESLEKHDTEHRSREKRLEGRETSIESREERVERRENEIVSKEMDLKTKENELRLKEEHLGCWEDSLASGNKSLEKREAEFKIHQDEVDAKEDKLKGVEERLALKREKFEKWEGDLDAKKIFLSRMEFELRDAEKTVEKRNKKFEAYTEQLQNLWLEFDCSDEPPQECLMESAFPNQTQDTEVGKRSREALGGNGESCDAEMEENNGSLLTRCCLNTTDVGDESIPKTAANKRMRLEF